MSRWKLQFIGGTRKDNVELLNTLEDARRSGNRRLKKVFLETSTKCKADCKHCYYRNNKNLKEFTLDEICDIQDYLWDFGVRAITYAGADAIFRTDHNIILKRGKDKGFLQNYCTRGFLSELDELSEIIAIEPEHIQFSADPSLCNTKIEDEIHRIKTINELFCNSPIYVSWVITLTKNVLNHIFPLMQAISESGGNEVRLHKIVSYGMSKEYQELVPNPHEYLAIVTEIIKSFADNYSQGAIIVEDVYSNYKIVKQKLPSLNVPLKFIGCPMGQTALTIDNSGGVFICPMCKSPNMKIGESWRELETIWDNFNKLEPYSLNVFKNTKCEHCEDFVHCLGGCRCQAVSDSGLLWGEDPTCLL